MYSEDDIQYALETTEVIHEPDRRIDTFGSTTFEFQIISELMDTVQQVRVRTGKIHAQRPSILRPDPAGDFAFDGFGEQAEAFAEFMRDRLKHIALVRYGFSFKKSDVIESTVNESLDSVRERLVEEVRRSGNPLTAIIQGVDDTWEISLLKFTVEMIQKSERINRFDFKRRGLL